MPLKTSRNESWRNMALRNWMAALTVFCFKVITYLLDYISFPIYFVIDRPWRAWKLQKIVWSKLEDEHDPYSCYIRQVCYPCQIGEDIETMDQLFKKSVEMYSEKQCLGFRPVLNEEISENGITKLIFGEYEWLTFKEVNTRVDNFSKGLLALGVKTTEPVAILAETRLEWIVAAQACFRINVPVVTLYANLGEDGMMHSIEETEVSYIITSNELMPKLKNLLPRLPKVTNVIYMEGRKTDFLENIDKNIKATAYSDVEKMGEKYEDSSFVPPKPDHLAIIMYTSGSTGIPKGVMLTHKNILATTRGFDQVANHPLHRFGERDVYIAYLPAAHVLELTSECFMMSLGIRVGYSSPLTLTNYSPSIKKGEKGDFAALQPTLFITVPLMLERFKTAMHDMAGKEATFSRLIFEFAINYKRYWTDMGFQTRLIDKMILQDYRDCLGGKIRLIMCGSAPLSRETQTFFRCCFNVPTIQGYGLTESSACASLMDVDDTSMGRVGAPLYNAKLRLVDWKEGNYFVKDKPNPRGEVVVSGDSLALGYFKRTQETVETYKFEAGERWLYTGDIGEMFPDGTLKIIDRKKDLVKLPFGEYVALGKVESELKTHPLVENICVFGSGLHTYLIAFVVPNSFHLNSLAKELGKGNLPLKEMCSDKDITESVTTKLREFGTKCGLFGSEIPRKIKLCSEEWSPESGLVTAAFKIRRKYIETYYQSDITNMYLEA